MLLDHDKALRLLTEAIDLYREIGMPKHLEMAEELLAGAWAGVGIREEPEPAYGQARVNRTATPSTQRASRRARTRVVPPGKPGWAE